MLGLGLLVDDAIIAVEMMAIKMEQGFDRLKAASFAWTSTAFPMLTGTLITAAGFLPIATAQSGTGEYTRSIFQVVAISLIASWIAAVMFVPYLGDKLLPDLAKLHAAKHGGSAAGHDPYATPFYRRVRATVQWCVRHRITVIMLTIALFVGSVVIFRFVPQQFFPASGRLELMVDIKLEEGASLSATEAEVHRLEKLLKQQTGIDNYVAYVGTGSPRFYLPLDQQLPAASFAQFVVLASSIEERERLRTWLIQVMNDEFPTLRSRVSRLENGPPVGYPIQFRVSGEHIDEVRALARQVADKVRENPHVVNVHLDWEEPSKVVILNIDQDRARALGVNTAELSRFLQGSLSGTSVSQYREDNELIEILQRGTPQERKALSLLPSLAVPTDSGRSVALSQVATLEYGFEEGIIWHRNRLPNVTVRADIYGKQQPATLTQQILPTLEPIRASARRLPAGGRRNGGGFAAWAEVGERRRAAVHRGGADPADAAAEELLALGDGVPHCAAGADRGDPVPADLPAAVRLRRHARHHCPGRDDHAQLGDSGGSDRAGRRAWPGSLARHHRGDGEALPPHRADGPGGGVGDDPAVAQRVLRADGRGHHGRSGGGHRADPAVSAGTLRGLVPGQGKRGALIFGQRCRAPARPFYHGRAATKNGSLGSRFCLADEAYSSICDCR